MQEIDGFSGSETVLGDYLVVKALEDGVTVIGLTRGNETRFAHTEKLDLGEVWVSQFTKHTSALKVRGYAEVITKHGTVIAGRGEDHAKG
ncbi:MAG: trp RNA-binding attenuation protein MtrB [Synergistales bacterium]|nr:trp RNA-binding attenuation protein MtrB [Synergistales bacterium]